MSITKLSINEISLVVGGNLGTTIASWLAAFITPWIIAYNRHGGSSGIGEKITGYNGLTTPKKVAAVLCYVTFTKWKSILSITTLFFGGNVALGYWANKVREENKND